ncbi:sugar phosphate permease [Stella humosa]|uniref:Sugar phosphate permease n=1 Tax=Stella humosa TaxID=94 RepID=A0A3N1KV59_9PROT|nr:MFS transporter [Stella humosa]ROP84471.1 sugar phosphate permease [Stella humosa]BBK33990.1 MFS transporter [Stella humosa]
MGQGVYHGWRVVFCAFAVAFFGWGLGFYGPGIYLVALRERHGWSTASISAAITVYYVAGAFLIAGVGAVFDRFGQRPTIIAASLAMATGVVLLSLASHLWQVYAAFLVMAAGWAAMGTAAVNAMIAPWFERRRGLAVSLALNGASCGGVVMAPVLVALVAAFGFRTAIWVAAAGMLVLLVPLLALVLRQRRPEELEDRHGPATPRNAVPAAPWRAGTAIRSRSFLTISLPFALGLVAQVGLLTHQLSFLSPSLGVTAAGWAISITTAAAVAGRVGTGFFVDRLDPRRASAVNFVVQIAGTALLLEGSVPALYAGCVLFGLGVGNLITFPALIVQREFPAAHFARVVGLVVAVNQFTFAFGPGLLGLLREWRGSYDAALVACMAMQAAGAAIVLLRPRPR